MIIVTPPFLKSSVFKKCFHQTRTKSRRLHIPPVFEKLRFRDGLIVDGRPNRRNKAAFSNLSSVVWTMPKKSPLSHRSIYSYNKCFCENLFWHSEAIFIKCGAADSF